MSNSYTYQISNTYTGRVLYQTDDLYVAKRIFHSIPRRKNGYIQLMDMTTGEIIKHKRMGDQGK